MPTPSAKPRSLAGMPLGTAGSESSQKCGRRLQRQRRAQTRRTECSEQPSSASSRHGGVCPPLLSALQLQVCLGAQEHGGKGPNLSTAGAKSGQQVLSPAATATRLEAPPGCGPRQVHHVALHRQL